MRNSTKYFPLIHTLSISDVTSPKSHDTFVSDEIGRTGRLSIPDGTCVQTEVDDQTSAAYQQLRDEVFSEVRFKIKLEAYHYNWLSKIKLNPENLLLF